MVLIDTVKQMQAQGIGDTEIIQKLQEQGLDPREINDSLSQSRIKAAVSEGYETNGQESVINNSPSDMQPSVMSQQQVPEQQQQQEQQYLYPAAEAASYSPEYYQPQSQSPGLGSETITEIADQIFSEKTSDIRKALSILADFKSVTEAKLSGLDSRLKKIEMIIEKLQSSIIGKVGEFGQSVNEIKDEMSMMQESFSKVVNKAVGGRAKIEEPSEQQATEEQQPASNEQPRRKKQKDGFENYLSR